LKTINSLRLAEIQNYFGNDCILAAFNQNNDSQLLGDDTAVISSIVLADKTGILLTLPKQEQHLHWLDKSRENLRAAIGDFRNGLLDSSTYNTTAAASLYELIISPLEKYLAEQKIKTLVFIQDSFLRDIPMAALYDKQTQQYLIQKYAIGTTSSLQLTNLNPGNLKSNRTLILAVSRETKVDEQIFEGLENVPLEVQAIKQVYPNSKKLENEDFSIENLKKQIQNIDYPIIHIATHAQFGVIPEDTFIVTGNSEKLTINQLEILLRESKNFVNSGELLTLTACETATGDERTALGLAGVALQAGTKSALASLWSVNDESTTHLVTEFYNQLRNSGMSKAAALQAAQLKLINAKQISDVNDKYDHPYYWSAFILIGNWL
jgi:CHAT domain-containing protein